MAEPTGQDRTPTVVVSHLDVTYRVLGSGRRGPAAGQGESPRLRRMLARGRPSIGYREIAAVQDVSFVAHHGESIGIIGRNGSGKSTLLRAVAGLIPPTSGRLWVAGEPSLLGVNAVLMNKLSGERNIYIGGEALGLSTQQIRERFDDIVEFSGIGDAVYLPMGTYSSGMGARLRFAISTAAAPDVLMIDEALAAGDAEFRQRSAERIAQIREQAGTVFLVSHSNSNIRQICDRVLWMDRGRLIMDGPTEEVMPEYEATQPRRTKASTEPAEPEVAGVERWGGSNRFEAAASATLHSYQAPVEGCFLVSSHRMAHARAAAPVAARLGWPLVWTRPSALPGSAREQLTRLQPGRVVVVGGEEMVRGDTAEKVAEIVDGPVERVGSDDPAQTSAALLRAFPPGDDDRIHVTMPPNDTTALSIGVVAAQHHRALLVADPDQPHPDLLEAVRETAPVTLVLEGGPEDWSPRALEVLADASGRSVSWQAHEGAMLRVARCWGETPPGGRLIVAPINAGLEQLTALAVSGRTGEPLYLVRTDQVPAVIATEIRARRPDSFALVGGVGTVRAEVRAQLGQLLLPEGDGAQPRGEEASATDSSAATKAGPPTAQS